MKDLIKTVHLILSSLFLYITPLASNWLLIDKDKEMSSYLDAENIKVKTNNIASYWIKLKYEKDN